MRLRRREPEPELPRDVVECEYIPDGWSYPTRFSAAGAPEDPVDHRSFLFNR
jgi:hypothetical protein